ncbi:MAG: cytochrome c oxidase subunit II [Planctomycetota bacterium]
MRIRLFRRSVGGLTVAAATLLTAAPAWAQETVFPENASKTGQGVDDLFWLATWLGAGAFVIVIAILVYSMIAFRERPGYRATPYDGDNRKARLWTGAFAIVVFVVLDVQLAIVDHNVFEEMYGNVPAESESLVVQCIAKQFEWHFRYPGPDGEFETEDDMRSVNVLRVPSDRATIVKMRSIDVVHSFFMPQFRTKQDAVPGMTTSTIIRPAKEGSFSIACAELCGPQHYAMANGRLEVMAPEAWEAWRKEAQAEIAEYGADETGEEFWAQWMQMKREDN